MAPADWITLSRLLDEALAMDAELRPAWLERLQNEPPEVRSLLRNLLCREDLGEAGSFMRGLPRFVDPQSTAETEAATGDEVGSYRLVRLLGVGGMGAVWLAERSDGLFKRQVALKLPHLLGAVAGLADRMARERQILAALEHPNIARLYDAGLTSDGRPYLALEYIEGVPIDEYCSARQLNVRARLELMLQVARAVAYAHSRLVVHRDIKPANIQVDAQGQVHLLDFGIAKLLVNEAPAQPPADASLTYQLGIALTPNYAAPEQVYGEPVSTASDVYSLGAVLYEMLAGHRAYTLRTDGPLSLAQAIRAAEIRRPSDSAVDQRSRRELRGDLDTIILKAMKKLAMERYQTVAELGDDLERYLKGESVRARPDSTWYRTRKYMARNRLVVGSVAAVLAALAIGLGSALVQARRIAQERDIARSAATREEAVRYHLTRLFRASAAEHADGPPTAKAMLDRSAQRVLGEYQDDPYLAGKVVVALADLYGALEDIEGEAPLLEGFLARAGTTSDPQAIAGVQQKLAEVELLRGNTMHANGLLDSAEAFWQRSPQLYREERLEGLTVRGRLQRAQGNLAGSLATYQTALRERVLLSGLNHRETAGLYNSLAITFTALNRLDEALSAYTSALDIYRQLGHGDDIDALVMTANRGTLALRFGRLAEATQLLHTAFEKQRAAAGNSAAVASAMGYYGSALDAAGRSVEAVAILKEATAIGEQFGGAASPLALHNQQFLYKALWNAGEHPAAEAMGLQNQSTSSGRYGAAHPLSLLARMDNARFKLLDGQARAAEQELAELLPLYRKLADPGLLGLAQALLLQGEVLLAETRFEEAVAPLSEAAKIRERLLWDQSWELAEARARLGEALLVRGDSRGRALLEQAAAVLQSQLGSTHPQTLRAARILARPVGSDFRIP
ncbi:MAG TPA: serine/threonine-protein kinase [Steroidobacteraceae bacterium]|jgi:serine/threonine protein kinase